MTRTSLLAATVAGVLLGFPAAASAVPLAPSAKQASTSTTTEVTFKRRHCDPGVSGFYSGFSEPYDQPYYSGFYGGYGGGYYDGYPAFYGAPYATQRRAFRDRRYWRTRRPEVGIGVTF